MARFLMRSPILFIGIGLLMLKAEASAFQLTGTVVDTQGMPIHDVDLDVQDRVTGADLSLPDDNTDRDGRFALEIEPGHYRVFFEPPPGLALAPHVVPRLELAGDVTLDVTLRPGLGLAGRITDSLGAGVAEVDLDVWDRVHHVKLPTPDDQSNSLGFYSLVVPAGTYDILAYPPVATRLAPMRVDSISVVQDVIVNLRLDPGFILSGTVRGANGTPASGIDIDATDFVTGADMPLVDDRTDGEGRFAVVLRQGRYRLGVDAPASSRLVSSIVPDLTIDADLSLEIDLTPGFLIEGRVRDPVGQLVEGADLDFMDSTIHEVVPTPSDFSNALGGYAVVLPQGMFDLITQPPEGASYQPDTTRAVEVAGDRRLDVYFGQDPAPPPSPVLKPVFPNPSPGGATIPFELPAGSGGPVRITIADAAGRIVRLLDARAGSGEGAPWQGQADWDGRDKRGLIAPSGVYFVRLEAGGQVATRKLTVFRESPRNPGR